MENAVSCKTALVIVNSATSPGHPRRRRPIVKAKIKENYDDDAYNQWTDDQVIKWVTFVDYSKSLNVSSIVSMQLDATHTAHAVHVTHTQIVIWRSKTTPRTSLLPLPWFSMCQFSFHLAPIVFAHGCWLDQSLPGLGGWVGWSPAPLFWYLSPGTALGPVPLFLSVSFLNVVLTYLAYIVSRNSFASSRNAVGWCIGFIRFVKMYFSKVYLKKWILIVYFLKCIFQVYETYQVSGRVPHSRTW